MKFSVWFFLCFAIIVLQSSHLLLGFVIDLWSWTGIEEIVGVVTWNLICKFHSFYEDWLEFCLQNLFKRLSDPLQSSVTFQNVKIPSKGNVANIIQLKFAFKNPINPHCTFQISSYFSLLSQFFQLARNLQKNQTLNTRKLHRNIQKTIKTWRMYFYYIVVKPWYCQNK